MRNPRTPEEWQEAVNGAQFYLLLDSARQYGLVEGGPVVNAQRCAEILEGGQKRDIYPATMDELLKRFIG